MSEVDFDEVLKLLSIPEKVANVAPGLTHISAEAMARLRKINAGLEEAKSRDATPMGNLSGMPVAPNVPSQPVEAPESTIAEQAPEETEPKTEDLHPVDPTPANAAPRVVPSSEFGDEDPASEEPIVGPDLGPDPQPKPVPPEVPAEPDPNIRRT